MEKINKPIAWALIYLSMIPIFAVIYNQNASSFRVSDPRTDTGYAEVVRATELLLLGHYANLFREFCDNCEDRTVAAWLLETTSQGLSLEATYIDHRNRLAATTSVARFSISVMPQQGNMAETLFIAHPVELTHTSVTNREFEEFLNWIESHRIVDFDQVTQHAILDIIDREDGVYNSTKGNFSRYVYLSVVVATTLGFGDIVPITDFARYLISAQAVLGIVLMGLFFNSLALSSRKK